LAASSQDVSLVPTSSIMVYVFPAITLLLSPLWGWGE
jgi:hypothetical protein